MKKKMMSLALAVVMCLSLCVPALAVEPSSNAEGHSWVVEPNFTPEEAREFHKIEGMSKSELQSYIDDILTNDQTLARNAASRVTLEALWYAAAQYAILSGYECAGTLVQYSVRGQNYSEGNSTFANKIKTTRAFSDWKADFTKTNIEFNSSDNSDLYYAIHGATIHLLGSSQGGTAHIYDTFDFEYSNLSSLFATLVNNWGALSQNLGVLKPISVHIEIRL